MDIAYYLELPLKMGLAFLGFALFLMLIFLGILGSPGKYIGILDRKVWRGLKQDYKDPNIVLGGPIGIVLILLKVGLRLTVIGLITWGFKLVLY